MKGRRIYPQDPSSLEGIEPGDYWKDARGCWMAACPVDRDENGMLCLANLAAHLCTEKSDGTLTVNPSILVSAPWGPDRINQEFYHGFLIDGFWSKA